MSERDIRRGLNAVRFLFKVHEGSCADERVLIIIGEEQFFARAENGHGRSEDIGPWPDGENAGKTVYMPSSFSPSCMNFRFQPVSAEKSRTPSRAHE